MSLLKRISAAIRFRLKGGASVIYLAGRYPNYQIGRGSYGDLEVLEFGEGATLRIGAYCSFARGSQIFLGGEHRTDWVTTYPFTALDRRLAHIEGHPKTRGDVTVGSDVWFGREAMVMSGVTIGDGAVIGARSLVTKDVPPYAIASGNPARVVRERFAPEIVARLLAAAWWTWEPERIAAAAPLLLNSDIEAFLAAVEEGRL
jgi:acetyltransferase-like isoleucine patch superfamily enzyme